MNAVGFGLRVTLVGLSAWNLLTAGAVMMIHLTIPWQVMQTTGSPVRAGLSVAVELAAFSVSCLLGTPLALGSYWGLVVLGAMMPCLLWRLVAEERFLAQRLPGYTEYQQRVRHRLVPFVW